MEAAYFHYTFNVMHQIQTHHKLLYSTVLHTRIYLISRYGLDGSAFVPLSGQEIFSSHPTRPTLVLTQWAPGLFTGGNASGT